MVFSSRTATVVALGLLLVTPQSTGAAPECYAQDCDLPCAGSWPHLTTLVRAADYPVKPSRPVAFVDPGDGFDHRLIPTLEGRVWVWNEDPPGILPTPYLDLSTKVSLDHHERGLQSLAFDPDFATNGYLYVFYTRASLVAADHGDVVVERYTRASATAADPGSALRILEVDHSQTGSHNGGGLAFGADGMLYVALGDGGGTCDDDIAGAPHGQNPGSLLGKLLRLDVRGTDLASEAPDCGPTGAYGVPSDNPFAGATAECGEIWATGLRNPFRLSVDRETGDLWLSDVGQNDWEEINFIPADYAPTSSSVRNFGWRLREGCETCASSCFPLGCPAPMVLGSSTCGYPTDLDPGLDEQLAWDPILCHDNRNNPGADWQAAVAGFRYRGSEVSALDGAFLYGDPYCGEIWRTDAFSSAAPAATTATCWDEGNEGLYAFSEDGEGELYLLYASGRIACVHAGAGCVWAGPTIFRDDFATGDTSVWTLTGDEPATP